jgi:hypothetical protein
MAAAGALKKKGDRMAEEDTNIEKKVWKLCETPFETGPDYFRLVVEARLEASEATVQAAHYAMLHQGAKGYVSTGEAHRRLREAYFVAIVIPSTKQLRKMLSGMPAAYACRQDVKHWYPRMAPRTHARFTREGSRNAQP